MELVQLFQENCVSKEIAHCIRRLETMPEVWERLDSAYDLPIQFINELTLEVLAIPKINDGEYEKQLECLAGPGLMRRSRTTLHLRESGKGLNN
jgi:hypothetical protein